MKLNSYKANVVEYMSEIFPDKEKLKQQVKNLYIKGDFNNFETYAAACIMHFINRCTEFSLYDMIMHDVPTVTDSNWTTLYKAAFKEYMGCTLIDCVK